MDFEENSGGKHFLFTLSDMGAAIAEVTPMGLNQVFQHVYANKPAYKPQIAILRMNVEGTPNIEVFRQVIDMCCSEDSDNRGLAIAWLKEGEHMFHGKPIQTLSK